MSVTTEKLAYLQGTKEEIRNAIIEKGVDVSTSDTFRSYAGSIRKISTGGVRSCRFVIGTSTAGWTEKDCDYLCDGVDDQVEINAAIQALPSTGGEIKVLDGTYNITASINIDKEGVTFGGCGQNTIFKRMWKSSSSTEGVIQFSKSYCTFKDFEIDGNKSVYAGGSGLYLTKKNMTDILVKNVYCNNNTNGVYLSFVKNSTVTGNTCNNNNNGVYLSSAQNSTVTGNTCNNNSSGVYLSSVQNSTVTGNTCNNNNYGVYLISVKNSTVTGNTCNNNNYGVYVYLSSVQNSTVTGNTCNNNIFCGVYLSSATNSTATGNTCLRGTGTSSDYTSSQHTIYTDSNAKNCAIVGNNCSGKAPTVAGTGNIVENNLV